LQHTISDKRERIKNVRGKFVLKNALSFSQALKRIIVFDDVTTTGATLNEVCRLIRENNEQLTIDCFVLSKA